MASVNEIAWLAGIADGEGSFYISKGRLRDSVTPHFRMSFAVSNTNELIMKGVKRIVSSLIGREKRYIPIKVAKNNKPTWNLQITRCEDLKIFCNAILPFLEGKKEQARVMLEYCELISDNSLARNGLRIPDYRILTAKEKLALKMGWLNKNPGKPFPANDLTGSPLNEVKAKSELHSDMQSATEMVAPALSE